MKTALGRLGWTPAAFWASTPHELWAGFDGWVEANCPPPKDHGPLSDEEIFTLEDLKRRFPDEKPGRKSKREKTALTPEMAKGLFEN